MRAAVLDSRLTLLPHARDFKADRWDEAIGCSGTIKAIANIVHAEGWCLDGITYKSLKKLRDALIEQKYTDKFNLAGLSENRKPVIAGGLAVLLAIFETLKIEQMQVSEQSMREGLLYDLVGRITHHDVRDATIEAYISRWGVDLEQAQRVTATVERLCSKACEHGTEEVEQVKPLVKWASMLHEIGLQVSHNNYHKHGAYILTNADMQGFSRQEQALLAALVLAHRSKFRTDAFKQLMKPFVKTGQQMCILLRLAVLLHRERTDQPAPEIDIRFEENNTYLRFPEGWLDDHSMTLADLIIEIDYLDKAGYKLSFV